MKKKKTKLFVSLSILIIVLLIGVYSLNIIGTNFLVDDFLDQNTTKSLDESIRKWNLTEVISTESTAHSQYPSIAIDSAGNIHIVWEDITNYAGSGTESDIFYKCWDTALSSWTITEVVSTESATQGGSTAPALAVDSSGNVHVVWEGVEIAGTLSEHQIFYKSRNALTQTWTTTELVSNDSTDFSGFPSLDIDNFGNIHVTWYDLSVYSGAGADYDIFYKRKDFVSSSWTITEVVSTESTQNSASPSLAVDPAGNVHIAWYDMTNYASAGSDWDIFYKRWISSNSSWTMTDVVSTESSGSSYAPSLVINSFDNIHIAWADMSNYLGAGADLDIFYKRWTSSTSWTLTEVVSTTSTMNSEYPSLAVDLKGDIHITWQDMTNYAGSGGDNDIFYRRCDYSFSSWDQVEVISSESVSLSFYPSLAIDTDDNVHIAWDDITNYNGAGGSDYDIFYKVLSGPPAAPELEFIVPNPIENDSVNLNWREVNFATAYHVYHSTDYIVSVEELTPITTTSSSSYIDNSPSEGLNYYVVVAENFAGNSSLSNCQYVNMIIPELETPELSHLIPNPTDSSSVALVWDSVDGAIEYYVYRSNSYIWTVEGLTPIATVGSNSYVDTLPSQDYYFFVIVANDGIRNSTHSNCEYVEYKIPSLDEFVIISSLIVTTSVLFFVITRIRKKNPKQN